MPPPLQVTPFTAHLFSFFQDVPAFGILLVLMFFDVLTGLIAGFITKEVSSKISYRGMLRKVFIIAIVGVVAFIDRLTPDIPESKLTCMFFVITELLSITENAARAGVPLPPVLVETLASLRKTTGAKESTTHTIERETTHEVRILEGRAPRREGDPNDTVAGKSVIAVSGETVISTDIKDNEPKEEPNP